MEGSIRSILPDDISEESERLIEETIKRKARGMAARLVRVVRAFQERFGAEADEVLASLAPKVRPRPADQLGTPEEDLAAFCQRLDRGCAGSHRWVKEVDEPRRKQYRYTRCMWAEIFRELDAADIGRAICEGDEPAVRSFNPKLGFSRTKLLMDGDDCCDHCFFVRDAD